MRKMTATKEAFMDGVLYDDRKMACGETALVIKRYYPWGHQDDPVRMYSVD